MFFSSTSSSLITNIARPFWSMRDTLLGKAQNVPAHIEPVSSLTSQISSLQDALYALQVENLELKTEMEATSIQSLAAASSTRIMAKVISKPPYSAFDTFILDRGTSADIRMGDKVYIGTNIFIGTIVETGNNYAKVQLFSSGSSSVNTSVLRTGEPVLLRGRGGGNFDTVAPKDMDVVVGDTLVDASAHQSLIAVVYSVDSSSLGSFKTLYSRIPLNILSSQWVSVSH